MGLENYVGPWAVQALLTMNQWAGVSVFLLLLGCVGAILYDRDRGPRRLRVRVRASRSARPAPLAASLRSAR